MIIRYKINGELLTEDELRRHFYYVSFPTTIKPEELPEGVTVIETEDTQNHTEPTLDELKEQKCADIRAESDRRVGLVRKGYSAGEVETFVQQYSGAKFVIGTGGTMEDSLFVSGLLANRIGHIPTQTELNDFALRIASNYEKARDAIISIVGAQQKLELAVRAASTEKEVEDIAWGTEA